MHHEAAQAVSSWRIQGTSAPVVCGFGFAYTSARKPELLNQEDT
jgi:hypothetical protein